MMKSLGMRVSALGVAEVYRDFLDVFVLDAVDARQASKVEALGMRVVVTDTIMTSMARKKALARVVVGALGL
jgi:LPPG:FO 2-phospho-L-lactate transferase